MAKFNFQQFMLAKGEKIGLGLAVGGLGLLGIWGISSLAGAKSPQGIITQFKGYQTNIEGKIRNDAGTPADLPEWARSSDKLDLRAIDPDNFPVRDFAFEPVDRPSRARENPKVLGIKEAQLDLVRLNMKAYDIKGTPGNYTIGVMNGVDVNAGNVDSKSTRDLFKKFDPRARTKKARPPQQNPMMGPNGMPIPGGQPGGGGGPPPGAGGSAGGPPAGMTMPGMGSGDMSGPGPGMMAGAGQYTNKLDRYEKTVKPINIDEFDPAKHQPAFVVYPKRVIVMHAVFPLKEQLEVVRRALRLRTIDEAARETSGLGALPAGAPGAVPPPMGSTGGSREGSAIGTVPGGGATATTTGGGVKVPEGPTFAGFEVQRKVIDQNGREYDWDVYDHVGWYLAEINNRKIADQPDEGYLPYFIRYDQEMAMPLPAVAEGQQTYPPISLPSIVQSVQKMKDSQRVPMTPSELQQKLNGKGNSPFTPSFLPPTGAAGQSGPTEGFFGSQGGGTMNIGPGRGGMMMPPMGGNFPPGVRGGVPGNPGYGQPGGVAGASQEIKAPVELEHMLIRFMDVNIVQGLTYEYRIRVKMKNPNYGIKNVTRPTDAEVPILYGPWVQLANPDKTPMRVTVPIDVNTYLVDPVEYRKTIRDKFRDQKVVNLLDNQNGKLPVIQVQQWLEKVAIESKEEPIGAWVVGDIPVSRGEFIGKRQLTTLPLWSSQKVRYILQELPKYKVNPTAKEQPKGQLVDFTTSNICVDYEGGLQTRPFGERTIEDDGAVEMLVLNADGTLKVKSSGIDMDNPERQARVKLWDEWLDRVKKDTEAAGALGPQQTDNGFGPGGGVPPKGP